MYSELCAKIIESPYHSGKRKNEVSRITPHCFVGQVTIDRIGKEFKSRPAGKEASCNYGIGKDGRIIGIVDEINRSWCSSSSANDDRAITIECASDSTTPYTFNNEVYESLIKLCVDICKRYNKTKLIYIGSKTKALAYKTAPNEMLITLHRYFANKACPGDWLVSKLAEMCDAVNAQLNASKPQLGTNAAQGGASGAQYKLYTVKPGDNLTKIGRIYGLHYTQIAKLNKIVPPYIIRPGQILKIPN